MLCGGRCGTSRSSLGLWRFMGCTSRVYHTLKLKSGAEGTVNTWRTGRGVQ